LLAWAEMYPEKPEPWYKSFFTIAYTSIKRVYHGTSSKIIQKKC
jgi:hypothetical protein